MKKDLSASPQEGRGDLRPLLTPLKKGRDFNCGGIYLFYDSSPLEGRLG
jgi:hypothetical protein